MCPAIPNRVPHLFTVKGRNVKPLIMKLRDFLPPHATSSSLDPNALFTTRHQGNQKQYSPRVRDQYLSTQTYLRILTIYGNKTTSVLKQMAAQQLFPQFNSISNYFLNAGLICHCHTKNISNLHFP